MKSFRNVNPAELSEIPVPTQGLVGWLWELMKVWQGERRRQEKQLHLIDTLSLGGKRQLMLVSCEGESFLIGCGLDTVDTIAALKTNRALHSAAKNSDETC
jgi:flagellar biogenesis protein FliO